VLLYLPVPQAVDERVGGFGLNEGDRKSDKSPVRQLFHCRRKLL
jgi:hypothetical protein